MNSLVQIRTEDCTIRSEYTGVPMYVDVDRILALRPIDGGIGGFQLIEEAVDVPYRKTYQNDDEDPIPIGHHWDISRWGFFSAVRDEVVVGGCVVAIQTEQVRMLEGRTDLAALWDIRVHPELKNRGIGTGLFQTARTFAKANGCRFLKIETQNVNVPACRFYRKQGCHLGGILQHAYKDFPEEIELLWYLELT